MKNTHETWQQALAHAVTDISELCALLSISPADIATSALPLRAPREFVARMKKGNPFDPLLLQVLPQAIEHQKFPGYSTDPTEESKKNPVPGLLHKYPHRVLLTLTGGCAIHCRYCFRRHFPYENNLPGRDNWEKTLNYIRNDVSIEEVILSGGDPLVLKDHLLAEFIRQLEDIPNLQRLRIHTRLPIVIPQRITDDLVATLSHSRFQTIMVVHSNHPNELDDAVLTALKKLNAITLLNQSVLLKNVNDDAMVLSALHKKLFSAGVLPYYLHLLDKVDGSAHFEVPEEKALEIMRELKKMLPGFLVPKLAREVPGMLHKDF
ncbi:MAG: EF-P beta-lysylation protein EpmB [Coxiellaceae bacterium]|nr:EF-P beta-lysylation protein EpmB [Coxiellaceae bacterium]